eukprot:scaffold52888_cov70-Phaeocystis_antarctica.AAC.3
MGLPPPSTTQVSAETLLSPAGLVTVSSKRTRAPGGSADRPGVASKPRRNGGASSMAARGSLVAT